jgi:universal stress protein E
MNATLRRILVAVEHTDRMPTGLIHKAALLAQGSGALIELFHAVGGAESQPPSGRLSKTELVEWRAEVVSFRLHRLRQFARSRTLRGVSVKCTVVCDEPASQAIVRQALATHADLVLAGTHRHSIGARIAAPSIDWELIRQCPVPLLIVKSGRSYRHAAVVTAVDPFHANDKPASLDLSLLKVARRLARLFDSDLHIFHAYMPLIPAQTLPIATGAPFISMPPQLQRLHQAQVVRKVDRLAHQVRIPKAHRHVEVGHTTPELAVLLKQLNAGVLVMGAVSRSGLQRLLIGNTAERVLDAVPCDVLVVKPARFRSKLLAHRPATRAHAATSISVVHAL